MPPDPRTPLLRDLVRRQPVRVAVLGAGPAGIGAAYRLAQSRHHVVVLERADRVGGAAGSTTVGGLRVDHGSHRLHPATDPAILVELRRLLGGDLQTRRRNGRIRLLDRWIAFPLRPADLATQLPPRVALAAARDAATARVRTPGADTYAEVLRAKLGPTVSELFYLPYARKLWGLAPEEISGEQARRRVSADSAGKLVARVVRGARGDGQVFHYPRRGFGQLWERLGEEAVAYGAEVRLGSAVERVHFDGDAVTVHTAGGGVVEASYAWSTLPLPVLARLVDPPPAPEVLAAAGRLRFRSMVLVYLVLDTDRYSPFDAHYLPGLETPVTRISEPKNYRDSADDPPGRTVLCFEVPCSPGDGVWEADDAALGDLAGEALRVIGLADAPPAEVVVRRLPRAYPVYDLGYDGAVEVLERWVAGEPRLLTFGRQGLFVHDNSHHALTMAFAAAEGMDSDGRFDEAWWSHARERFRDHVVED